MAKELLAFVLGITLLQTTLCGVPDKSEGRLFGFDALSIFSSDSKPKDADTDTQATSESDTQAFYDDYDSPYYRLRRLRRMGPRQDKSTIDRMDQYAAADDFQYTYTMPKKDTEYDYYAGGSSLNDDDDNTNRMSSLLDRPIYADISGSGVDYPLEKATKYKPQSYKEPQQSSSGGFGGFLNALAAFLPIGLFLAAIPPNLIVINSNQRRKKRSVENSEIMEINAEEMMESRPFLRKIGSVGWEGLKSSPCQFRLMCEMALFTRNRPADKNSLHRTENFVRLMVRLMPNRQVLDDRYMDDLIEAIKESDCSKYYCRGF